MVNTDSTATATFPMADGRPVYDGDTAIAGVPGTGAEVRIDFDGIAGGSCGALLPTANVTDRIDGITTTLIDNGMPVVVLRAGDLGSPAARRPDELEANEPCAPGSSRSGCRPATSCGLATSPAPPSPS